MYDGPDVKEKIKKENFLRDHKKVFYFLSPKNGHKNKVLFCLSLKTVVKIKFFSYSLSHGFLIFSPQSVVLRINKGFLLTLSHSVRHTNVTEGG